jgi:hypothetical protein
MTDDRKINQRDAQAALQDLASAKDAKHAAWKDGRSGTDASRALWLAEDAIERLGGIEAVRKAAKGD